MANRNKSDERRKHDRITIKNNIFTAMSPDSRQKCVVLDISVGGLSLRYYEGSELIKQIADEKSVKLDLFIDKGDLCLSQIPFKTVYDAEIKSELPLDAITIRKRGVKFGRLSKDQRSKLNDLVQKRYIEIFVQDVYFSLSKFSYCPIRCVISVRSDTFFKMANSIIVATGSYIPPVAIPNTNFLNNEFYGADGVRLERPNPEIIEKLYEITGIKERRHVPDGLNTSDIAYMAAKQALDGVDMENLDYIIVAQNLGDVQPDNRRTDMVPTIAARVKHKLKIKNPYTVALDIPFGCPGWLQAMIMADYYIKSGDAKRILVIGAETLSRVSDPHDVDSMIYADGAGATLLEATDRDVGILCHVTRSDTYDHAHLLYMGKTYNPNRNENDLYIKMHGHEIYKYAARTVPKVVKKNLEDAGFDLSDVKKILMHQANEKMDEAILRRLFSLYKVDEIPPGIMPMMISWAGNSSVATLPMMLDLIRRGKLDGHRLESGDITVFASVGAGMNINSMVYRMP